MGILVNGKMMSDRILIGSRAIQKWDKNFYRNPKDTDYFVLEKNSTPSIDSFTLSWDDFNFLKQYTVNNILTLEGAYNLKLSHLAFDINWWKHSKDIIYLQEDYGFANVDMEFYRRFFPIWENHYNRKKINLNKGVDDFFNDKITRKFDHDYIHEVISFKYPLYKKILKDGHSVLLDQSKFEKLSMNEKLDLCREEIYTIAIERYLLTNREKFALVAYQKSVKKVVTSLTKGWFNIFIIENLSRLKTPDRDYFKIFLDNC